MGTTSTWTSVCVSVYVSQKLWISPPPPRCTFLRPPFPLCFSQPPQDTETLGHWMGCGFPPTTTVLWSLFWGRTCRGRYPLFEIIVRPTFSQSFLEERKWFFCFSVKELLPHSVGKRLCDIGTGSKVRPHWYLIKLVAPFYIKGFIKYSVPVDTWLRLACYWLCSYRDL